MIRECSIMIKYRTIAIAVVCLAISIFWTGGAELQADDNPSPIHGCEVISSDDTQATVDCSELIYYDDGKCNVPENLETAEGWQCDNCTFNCPDLYEGEYICGCVYTADDDQNPDENVTNVEITVNSCERQPIVGLEDKEYASITVTGSEAVLINTVDTGGFTLTGEVYGNEQKFPVAWTLEEDSVDSLTLYFDLPEITANETDEITVTLDGETLEQEPFSGTAEIDDITNLDCEEGDE